MTNITSELEINASKGEYLMPKDQDEYFRTNDLIVACNSLPYVATNIFDYMLTLIHTNLDYRGKEKVSFITFNYREFFKKASLDKTNARIAVFRKGLNILREKTVNITTYDQQKGDVLNLYGGGIILEYDIKVESGETTLMLSNKLLPFIYQISPYQSASLAKYSVTSAIKSTNTKSFYNFILMRVCAGIFSFVITYDKLRIELGVPEGKYTVIGDFEKRFLKDCIRDLETKYRSAEFTATFSRYPTSDGTNFEFKFDVIMKDQSKEPLEISLIEPSLDNNLVFSKEMIDVALSAIKKHNSEMDASQYITHYASKISEYDSIDNEEVALKVILGIDPDRILS